MEGGSFLLFPSIGEEKAMWGLCGLAAVGLNSSLSPHKRCKLGQSFKLPRGWDPHENTEIASTCWRGWGDLILHEKTYIKHLGAPRPTSPQVVAAIEIIVDRELHQVFLKDKLAFIMFGGGRKQTWHFKYYPLTLQAGYCFCMHLLDPLWSLTPKMLADPRGLGVLASHIALAAAAEYLLRLQQARGSTTARHPIFPTNSPKSTVQAVTGNLPSSHLNPA